MGRTFTAKGCNGGHVRNGPVSLQCVVRSSLVRYLFLQIRQVRIRDSKFGPALVVDTTARSGGYVLGFRLDPKEALDTVFKEVRRLVQKLWPWNIAWVLLRSEAGLLHLLMLL